MTEKVPITENWTPFQAINANRRAIRDFTGEPLDDSDVRAVIAEALLAPSSANTQPFAIYWLRNPVVKAEAAAACRSQRGAVSAGTLLVFVAGTRFAQATMSRFHDYLKSNQALSEKSRSYHLRQLNKFRKFARIAPLAFWSPIHWLLTALIPSLTLIPIGPRAIRNWAARSAIFAAQTAMLAASARGLDSCPMEGFDAPKLSKILKLKRGDVIPIVVALGRRSDGALLEPQWRRTFEDAVCTIC